MKKAISFEVRTLVLLAGLSLALGGCGKGSDDVSSPETMSEIAAGALGGALSESEGTGALASLDHKAAPTFLEKAGRLLAPIPEAFAASCNLVCPTFADPGSATCAADGSVTFDYNGCSFKRNNGEDCAPSEWYGSQNVLFSSGCTTTPTFPLPAGTSLTRTVGGHLVTAAQAGNPASDSTYRVGPNGLRVFLDSADATGWQAPVSGGREVTFSSTSPVVRQIDIKGVNHSAFLQRPRRGDWKQVWDYTVDTPTPVVVQGQGQSRVVQSGTLRVQHNLLQCTGTITVTNVTYGLQDCPFPSSGKFVDEITCANGKTSTETLEFESDTCGSAKLNGGARQLSLIF